MDVPAFFIRALPFNLKMAPRMFTKHLVSLIAHLSTHFTILGWILNRVPTVSSGNGGFALDSFMPLGPWVCHQLGKGPWVCHQLYPAIARDTRQYSNLNEIMQGSHVKVMHFAKTFRDGNFMSGCTSVVPVPCSPSSKVRLTSPQCYSQQIVKISLATRTYDSQTPMVDRAFLISGEDFFKETEEDDNDSG